MAEVKTFKRKLEWWREENEVPDKDGRRLEEVTRVQEKYDASRLKPGWSGRDAPPVEQMGSGYSGQDARFDKLGSGSGEKTKKGDGQKKTPDVKETKKVKQRVKEDDLDLEMPDEGGEDENVNPENDIPPEMDDEALEGEETEELAQDITVDIGGKTYSLVPEEEPEMEGEEGMEEEPPMEEPNEAAMNGGVAAQDRDVTQMEGKKKNRRSMKENDEGSVPAAGGDTMGEIDYDKVLEQAMREAKAKTQSKQRDAAIHKALQMKKYAEQKLAELFTGSYVINKQGETGFDFKPVGGNEEFAVVDRAASGNQYTPIDSESPYEPNEKGGKTQHMTQPKGSGSYGESPYNKMNPAIQQNEAKKKKEAFKRWLASQEAKFSEDNTAHPGYHAPVNPDEDPGVTSDEFNKQDEFGSPEPRSPIKPEQYPEIPEIMGNEKDVITPSIGQKYGKSNFVGENKKYQQVQQRRKIRNESVEPEKKPLKEETAKEEVFDFKAFIKGEYNK